MLDKTTMREAFAKAGVKPRDVAMNIAIARYVNDGGSFDELRALVDAAERLSGGAINALPQGQRSSAPSRQPESSGEAIGELPQGQSKDADPLQPLANGGHIDSAHRASALPPPVREPTPAQTAASAAVAKQAALSVFDRELTYTGRRWGNIYYRELDQITSDAEVASAVKAHIGLLRGDERHKMVRDLMTPREFTLLLNKVRKHAA